MKLIINISKDDYNAIMARDWKNAGWLFSEELKAIHDGKIVEQEPCDDCISREEAIDAIKNYASMLWEKYNEPFPQSTIMEIIQALPPVTPQHTDAEIQKMQEMEQAEIQKAYELGKTEIQLSEDCISRQDAVNACRNGWGYDDETIEHIVGNILELPPVTPCPKVGRWEWVQYDYNPKLGDWHCSECRSVVVECVDKNEKGGIPMYKYCPQCGIKMQEVEE